MALWGGRFTEGSSDAMSQLSRSVHFDWRLAPYEIEVNLIHLENLVSQKVITKENGSTLKSALIELAGDIGKGTFSYLPEDEDVHSAIERGLIDKVGEIGGSIRAGRSRNDLVVTDFKLYLIDHLSEIAVSLGDLTTVLNQQAHANISVVAPGFTHTQHAQPISFSQVKPGDLLFFGKPISHVSIYLGGGKMVQAPRPGKRVEVVNFTKKFGAKPFVGARRI